MSNKDAKEPTPGRVFAYSSTPLLLLNLLPTVITLPVLVLYVISTNLVAASFFFVLNALLLGAAIRVEASRVHHALFFEGFFEVAGRKLNRKIDYKQVQRVEKVRVVPILTNRTRVKIYVSGGSSVVIPGNLRNPELKVDLYSWLSAKASAT